MTKKNVVVSAPVFPEVGTYKVQKDLQKVYKKMTDEQLLEWVTLEGLEYKECIESAPINRMRLCMAILYLHFPKETAKAKKASGWKVYTLEQLVVMASECSAIYEFSDHEAILRMRLIMALKAKGVTA